MYNLQTGQRRLNIFRVPFTTIAVRFTVRLSARRGFIVPHAVRVTFIEILGFSVSGPTVWSNFPSDIHPPQMQQTLKATARS